MFYKEQLGSLLFNLCYNGNSKYSVILGLKMGYQPSISGFIICRYHLWKHNFILIKAYFPFYQLNYGFCVLTFL
jgi:hypothetical protein